MSSFICWILKSDENSNLMKTQIWWKLKSDENSNLMKLKSDETQIWWNSNLLMQASASVAITKKGEVKSGGTEMSTDLRKNSNLTKISNLLSRFETQICWKIQSHQILHFHQIWAQIWTKVRGQALCIVWYWSMHF